MTRKDNLPAFSDRLDAVVLAGSHSDPKRFIMGRNKAFLEIEGRTLLQHVVAALSGAQSIADIFVVGPIEPMHKALPGLPEKVHLVAQEGNMLSNCWAGVHASEKLHDAGSVNAAPLRPFLIISCDLPIISAVSIDDFVARCADDDQAAEVPYGLMVGVADEESLAAFGPDGEKPGIVRPFVQLESARIRLANIYVARPWQLVHQDFLQTGFSFRKAIKWRNVIGLAFSVLSQKGGLQSAWLTLRLQATALTARRGGRLYHRLRHGNTRERLEACASKVLGSPLRLIITPFGGLSLDVDDEDDLRVITARYGDWMAIHNAVQSGYPLRQAGNRRAAPRR
jgi:molybdopterin-guanine dinucleotide biosynthesis protein A